ncbi:MAG: hypothetical protein GF401_10215 [Chitinivibrionales bacterium]|nr:hypothetical protein [Chitinivibrionales bacterium]
MTRSYLHIRTLILVLAAGIIATGCQNGIKVVMTGTIQGYKPSDDVFVALSRNWEKIYVSPRVFEIDPQGRFYLEFKIRKQILPVTFVVNNRAHARLTIEDMWSPQAKLYDEIRKRTFPITVDEQGVYRATLTL